MNYQQIIHSLSDIKADVNRVLDNSPDSVSDMPTGGPVIDRPTKEVYNLPPLAIQDCTSDGNYISYANMMYGKDINKFIQNDGIKPCSQDTK